jgi:hypothetical protein
MVLYARASRVGALAGVERRDEALREIDAVLADTEAAFAGRTRVYALRLLAFAAIELESGAAERAVRHAGEGRSMLAGYQDADALSMGLAHATYGRALLAAGRGAAAVGPLAQAERILRPLLPADNEMFRVVVHDHAFALAHAGEIATAVALLAQVEPPTAALSARVALQARLDRAALFQRAGRAIEAAAEEREAGSIVRSGVAVPGVLRARLASGTDRASGTLQTAASE